MKRGCQLLAGLCLFAAPLQVSFAAQDGAAAKKAEMARVAIVKYDDKTGSRNFEYMPGSLQEAITKSMHTKFEFVEIDAAKVEPFVAQVRKANQGKITPKEAAEICRLADIDILIYGNFAFNQAEQEIEIHTEISLGSTDKFRALKPVDNRVDATIFQAADRVAADIVAEITRVALEQQKQRSESAQLTKGKTQLQRTEKSTTWSDTNWFLSPHVGPVLPLAKMPGKPDGGSLAFTATRRLRGGWHVGLTTAFVNFQSYNTDVVSRIQFDALSGAAAAGYYWDLSARWRITTLLAAGYYFGAYTVEPNCSGSSCSTSTVVREYAKIRNPFVQIGAGIHFMVFSFFAVGIEAEVRTYYDSPKALPIASLSAALSFMF